MTNPDVAAPTEWQPLPPGIKLLRLWVPEPSAGRISVKTTAERVMEELHAFAKANNETLSEMGHLTIMGVIHFKASEGLAAKMLVHFQKYDLQEDIMVYAYTPILEEDLDARFNVTLTSFKAESRVRVIQLVRNDGGLALKDAKALVEGPLPARIATDRPLGEAKHLLQGLQAAGGEGSIAPTIYLDPCGRQQA